MRRWWTTIEASQPSRLVASIPRLVKLLATAFGLALLLVGGVVDAAGADPAKPTNFRSRIVSVTPPLPAGVELQVVGGDAFLDLRVEPGHRVTIPDYEPAPGQPTRPYLRVDPDGTVKVNENSTAAVINQTRYGSNGGAVSGSDAPRWRTVATNGRYAWHDHRIHFMLPSNLAVVEDNGRVDLGGPGGTWSIEPKVDGRAVAVVGELVLLHAPSPVAWYFLSAVVGLLLLASAWLCDRSDRPPAYGPIAGVLGVVAGAATVVGLTEWRTIPAGAGGNPFLALIPAVGMVAAGVALSAGGDTSPRARLRLGGIAAAVAALGCWAFLRVSVLSHAVLPSGLPFLDRATTATSLGLALAAGVLLVWRPPVATRN